MGSVTVLAPARALVTASRSEQRSGQAASRRTILHHRQSFIAANLSRRRWVALPRSAPPPSCHRSGLLEPGDRRMLLLTVFFISILCTEGLAVLFALLVEYLISSFASLLIFFPLFFSAIYLSWRFSVWYTRPQPQQT
jgi:hypothetical protein